MESYKIFYNDGVYAETFTFKNEITEEEKQKYFKKRIAEYNKNSNKLYHIGLNNIVKQN